MSAKDLLAQMPELPRNERAEIAEALLSSLKQEQDEEAAVAWAPELEHRSREIAEGKVHTADWGTARTDILKELEERSPR